MGGQQALLGLVLALMVFAVALELRAADFQRVAAAPRAVVVGLVPQFVLLPVATWLATLVLELPPDVEAAMILVAACPGGNLSNVRNPFRPWQYGAFGQCVGGGQPDRAGGDSLQLQLDGGFQPGHGRLAQAVGH